MNIPTFDDIKIAHNRIKGKVKRTPILSSRLINNLAGADLFFKCENFQSVGAFKFRGATNAIEHLLEDKNIKNKAVATHSSGNHAAALALAAYQNGMEAHIVMPENAPKVKIDAVNSYNAKIYFCKANLKSRVETLNEVIAKTNAIEIHPFQNFDVISGQGTTAIEVYEELDHLDFFVSPVGGGGLLSGCSIASKSISPNTIVIGAEPRGADDAFKSFYSGILVEDHTPSTICDGLLTTLGRINFEIISENVDRILTTSDESIIFAMKLIWERMKIVVEPSSATVLAVILDNKEMFRNKKIGLVLSGGNVDLKKLPW